jgi:hypothetical protein
MPSATSSRISVLAQRDNARVVNLQKGNKRESL